MELPAATNEPLGGEPPAGPSIGRVHLPAAMCPHGIGGPTPVAVRPDGVFDLSGVAPTVADLLDRTDIAELAATDTLPRLASLTDAIAGSHPSRRGPDTLHFLSPIDLQVVKACGVTFAVSALERVIEERSRGDAGRSAELRARLRAKIGGDLQLVVPGSEAAAALKAQLIVEGLWSQYLEVAIGPDAEVFTKAPVLSTVGTGDHVGVRRASAWNNPEPEVVLVVDSRNRIVGATLGNDVNLRDFEGRSALLLGEAKDNTASAAIGPWICLFEDRTGGFTLDALMATEVALRVVGDDGLDLHGENRLAEISRRPEDLVRQVGAESHRYPDGYALFLGTMYVPTIDRLTPGGGFTHRLGDRVEIQSPHLGRLTNWVGISEELPPWTLGIRGLWANLRARGLA
ncbi:MAG: fumarylacetoacetate hydrolase family protein [Candidatus Limnocylindrales bacterium]